VEVFLLIEKEFFTIDNKLSNLSSTVLLSYLMYLCSWHFYMTPTIQRLFNTQTHSQVFESSPSRTGNFLTFYVYDGPFWLTQILTKIEYDYLIN